MGTNPFAPAVRQQMKARVAFAGPTGSGKTWTALTWATVLADGGRVALIDTEHGSAALYSDVFTFDTVRFNPPYDPARLVRLLGLAEEQGYDVVVIDSLSHFWEGEGGTIDIADAAAQKARGNSFAGWKVATPALRHLVDTMLAHPAHVLATMRSKMEYVLEPDSKGRQVPRKVGMAPVMRNGIEYEFTLVADLDFDHRMMISKSRCSVLADELVQPNRADEAAVTFRDWLSDGEVVPPSPGGGDGGAASVDPPVGSSESEEPAGVNTARGEASPAGVSRAGASTVTNGGTGSPDSPGDDEGTPALDLGGAA